jgi:EAL domain-containing protein (putative c-di-GMP-specific phosphodiesterase class I)
MMEDDEIVRTILTLGRNLGLKVVAEGVETIEQVEKLQELECEFAQGYYFSVPVNAQEATDLLAARYHWPTNKPGRSNRRPASIAPTRIAR